MLRCLVEAVPAVVSGPSNIGNYLASRRIAATSGFGVNYRNLQAIDECIELATIAPVYEVYRRATQHLAERIDR